MIYRRLIVSLVVLLSATTLARAEAGLKVLLVDGQNNHDWKATTPVMKKHLEASALFQVDVATSPPEGEDMSGFKPNFSGYDVVLTNYNGDRWSNETDAALVDYVRGGGGLVVVHAADNAFPDWPEFNKMTGLGGWGERNEKWGPYVYFQSGEYVRDTSEGEGGSHGRQHEFQVVVRNSEHPITAGMPEVWLHTKDELYDRLRGPAENMTILATSYADPATGGSGRHEPMIFTIDYGKGRVFRTPMGHADYSLQCVGFITTLVRGTEWAATGKVTTKIPDDFPTAEKVSSRE